MPATNSINRAPVLAIWAAGRLSEIPKHEEGGRM
jgi:hypothetical protein